MIDNRYPVVFNTDFRVYEFDSNGPKGTIRKIIQYTEINLDNFFNLGFGDKIEETEDIDDLIVTDNNDSRKVLATVAATLFEFTNHYPKANVIVIGSTLAKTRLYRIGIINNFTEIEKDFEVYGFKNDNWYPFKKGIEYYAFLVRRKTINLCHHERQKSY